MQRNPSLLAVALALLALWWSPPAPGALRILPGDATPAVAAADQTAPAIAQGGNQTLAVWTDNRANPYSNFTGAEYETSRDIYGLRFDAAGNLLDALPFPVFAGRSIQDNPKVAWNGTHWLVAFESNDLGGTGYYQKSLAAVRVAPSGQVLDAEPIKLFGLSPLGGAYWALASDGTNWVVVHEGSPSSSDIVAVRIAPTGVVIDPPTRTLVKGTYYLRSNVRLAYAGGVFLMTYDDAFNNGGSDTKAVRFNSSLAPLDAAPLSLLPNSLNGLAGNGTGFYIVWNRQEPDGSVRVVGSRVTTAGARLDGTGLNLSGTKSPSGTGATTVAWDGLNWRVLWNDLTTIYATRVTTAGAAINPGSVAVSGPLTGPTAGTGTGGAQIVWSVFTNNSYEVYSANLSGANVATPNRALSIGAPQQLRPDVATSGSGYLVTYRSVTATVGRVLAQALDATATPLTLEPVELESGAAVNGPGSPAVAWNGSAYLVTWATTGGVVAQRLSPTGGKIDAAPFLVLANCFGPTDVAALGTDFLVCGRQSQISAQYIAPVAARVSGNGAVLDPSPLLLGNSYVRTAPAVVALGGRWLVVWHRNATHNDSYCLTMGAFVPTSGIPSTEFLIHGPFSTAGGNGVFEVGLAANATQAFLVQSQELTSGVETDLLGRLIDAAGLVGPQINLTPWAGNQYRPHVAWDGISFVVAYQEQVNRLAPGTLDQLDARSDLYLMRVSPTGTVRDSQGYVFTASPVGETDPNLTALNGQIFVTGALLLNDPTHANYRIAYDVLPGSAPSAIINASATTGDAPLTVSFNSGGGLSLAFHAWDFDDGSTATLPNPTHTFNLAGEYLVTLTRTDELGRPTTQARMINVTKPNQGPIAVATADKTSGNAPLNVVLTVDGTYDPDGFLGNLEWQFSDGSSTFGSPAYHTFLTTGLHTATLVVYDVRGAVSTSTLVFNVANLNQPPVARASATPTSGSAPLTVNFSSAGSTDADGTIIAYEWTFGDAFGTHSAEANPSYVYAYPGTYTATLTVWDNNNVASSANVVITVNAAPTNTLRSSAINLSGKLQGGKVTLTGNVAVVNSAGAAVSGAVVSATWTKPGGATITQTATTGVTGIAKFSTGGNRGTYTLRVNNITKSGWTFDSAKSVLTSSITK